jgi:hypothetical protein
MVGDTVWLAGRDRYHGEAPDVVIDQPRIGAGTGMMANRPRLLDVKREAFRYGGFVTLFPPSADDSVRALVTKCPME